MMLFNDASKWIEIRKSNLAYYNDINLYYKTSSGNVLLYKQSGLVYDEKYRKAHPYPGKLYIAQEDKIKSLQAVQTGFNKNFAKKVQSKNTTAIKKELINIMGETLSEPRSGSLQIVPDTVSTIVEGFSGHPDIIKNLALMSDVDYSTTMHSINVMALIVNFGYFTRLSIDRIKEIGLAALLHDVGKSEIPIGILTSNSKLTEEEFQTMKNHTILGEDILKEYENDLKPAIAGALEHHEKLDGSGYPIGKQSISETGKILGIIDCYEAITNDERPYRSAMLPIDALTLIKKDVDKGLFDKEFFSAFAYSLVDKAAMHI